MLLIVLCFVGFVVGLINGWTLQESYDKLNPESQTVLGIMILIAVLIPCVVAIFLWKKAKEEK